MVNESLLVDCAVTKPIVKINKMHCHLTLFERE